MNNRRLDSQLKIVWFVLISSLTLSLWNVDMADYAMNVHWMFGELQMSVIYVEMYNLNFPQYLLENNLSIANRFELKVRPIFESYFVHIDGLGLIYIYFS